MDEEDCYAEILKDDIIKLDESSMLQEAHTRPQETAHMRPCQGTAQRRIRLRVGNSRGSPPGGGVGFSSTVHPSKSNFFARMTNRLVVFAFFVFTLMMAIYFLSPLGGHKQVKYCGRITGVNHD